MFRYFVAFMLFSFSALAEVPKEWIEKSKSEPQLKIGGVWEDRIARKIIDDFSKEYPHINVYYKKESSKFLSSKLLVSVGANRPIYHMFLGTAELLPALRSRNALVNLSDLPEYKNTIEKSRGIGDFWTSNGLVYNCLAYNTNYISPKDLPKTLEDLYKVQKLQNRYLALAHQEYFIISLIQKYGKEKTKIIADNLMKIDTFKSIAAYSGRAALLNVGEYYAVFPFFYHYANIHINRGAPMAIHCFDDIYAYTITTAVLKNNSALYSSKIFTNWTISKNGQMSIFKHEGKMPIRKDMIKDPKYSYKNVSGKDPIIFTWDEYFENLSFAHKIWSGRF